MTNYEEIKSAKDVKLFESKTNCLHDGYMISVEYLNEGVSAMDGYIELDYRKTSLKICILVTSLQEKPTVELCFHGIVDWQIVSGYSEILDSAFSIGKDGLITWVDSYIVDKQLMRDNTFVIAERLLWRIL